MFGFTLTAFAMASAALAAALPTTSPNPSELVKRSLSGQATYYGGNVQGGTCSFSTYTLPSGLSGTALSDSNWNNAQNCGGCAKVNHNGKSVTVMVCHTHR
jgi:expansin